MPGMGASMKSRLGRRRVVACLALASLGLVALPTCGDDDEVAVLECTGTCSCDEETRTCSCQGSACVIGAYRDVTLACEGNTACDLQCGDSCTVDCRGTAGCTADVGDDGHAICGGTALCDITCGGSCSADCTGSSQCILRCAEGETCAFEGCPMAVDCGGGVVACRGDCPATR